jgi:hypothetical protein
MRTSIDGLTFRAWAGGQRARDLLDTMFRICKEKNYPLSSGYSNLSSPHVAG